MFNQNQLLENVHMEFEKIEMEKPEYQIDGGTMLEGQADSPFVIVNKP